MPNIIMADAQVGGIPEEDVILRKISSITNNTVSMVGSYAFANCTNLSIAKFSSATIIYTGAFRNTNIRTISFPNVQTIFNDAFNWCQRLSSASFPAVTSVGESAFYYNGSLSSVYMPNAVTLGTGAFARCEKLQTINFQAVETIGASAFENCSSLTALDFPAAKTIGSYAFVSCSRVTTASFPACTIISNYAFQSVYNMSSLYLMGSQLVSLIGSGVFSGTNLSPTYQGQNPGSIYVPSSMLASYQSYGYWSYYSSRFVGV